MLQDLLQIGVFQQPARRPFRPQIACAKLRALRDREQEVVDLNSKVPVRDERTKSKKVKILDFHPINQ